MFASSGCVGWLLALCICFQYTVVYSSVLTPPYFNLADGRRITATATCGEDVEGPELYCKLIGASSEYIETQENLLIQGQVCDHCDPTRPDKWHPPEFAVDGSETWWQSPPLSRGNKYNEVNLTIDLGQEFHVAYVLIKMANSPRPGVWVLEKSADNGQTWQPWQYFADTPADCESFFGAESLKPITNDDSVICETQYSQIVPLEGGEIVVSLLLNRPSANDFFNSLRLQEFTRATNVRFRLLRTKNLLGHLMFVARQDPTVTRRYYYSIKDISIGGRCRCNGHADTCDITDPDDPYKLLCRCQHNTCGHNCEKCCPGFEQKAWSQSKNNKVFFCEPCNCFGHTEECVYNKTVDALRLSIDIHGNYEGGGVCQNCRDNTEGINCDKCKSGFYRPHGYELNQTDVCQTCECNYFYSTGNCAEGTGQCECRKEFTKPNCDSCSFGYFDYPNCKPCECHVNGTRGFHCEADGGQCPCKPNYSGKYCDRCSEGFYKFPECSACECNPLGSLSDICDIESGNCTCNSNFGSRTCNQCGNGYYDFPQCTYCNCDARGTEAEVCDKQTGQCLCKTGYGGPRCDQCIPGYNGYPDCKPCGCSEVGSASTICDASGKCPCLYNFVGRTCEQCSPGYYKYPECLSCECNNRGSIGVSCDIEGKCQCRPNFDGNRCEQCKEGLYNFPICEECNCNPAGVLATFAGCGSLPPGELCQCKPRVHGRICDMCRPLYFNLQPYNPDGCEDCSCHMPGVAGNIAECDTKSGQCVCKLSVTSRRCDECVPGTYNLREDNLFGCTDCGCDIGGSVMSSCNKDTGQCVCQPRITGRTCKEPLQAHYFPTLYQFQFEAEEGHTPRHSRVRYGFADDIFPGYSWKGYAVFSQLQNEIIQEVYIQKPSLYRMVLRYINPNNESVVGKITITPDNPSDTEQVHQVLFKPSRQPAFVTVAGPTASIPSPLVMNPGQWSVSIKNDKSIFLDYFVLLPAAFYEVSILVNQVTTPCKLGDSGVCRHFQYPNVTNFDTVHGEGGYLTQAESREPIREFLNDPYTLAALKVPPMPLLNPNQNELFLDLRITRPGPHILVVNYVTPKDSESTSSLDIEARTQKEQDKGRVTLYTCDYTLVCREVVVDKHGKVAIFNFDTNYVNLVLRGDNANVAVESVVAIPEDKWHLDYLKPKQACVKEDGKCVQALFQNPGEAKKIEFEEGNEAQLSTVLPSGIYCNTTGLIYLDHKDAMIDVTGKVPHPGTYIFIVHYYQPDYPEFEMDVLLQNGQFYVGKLPLDHCPANSGCRSIVRQADGNTSFQLTENFVLTLKEPNHKSVWLDYVLVLPAESFTEHVIKEEALDQTIEFITHCAQNNYYVDERVQGFCRDAVFSITSAYNNGAIPCQCDYDGSLSFECEKFGGQCQCRPNVIGKRCEACKTGYFGFPKCSPCDCPSVALCEPTTGACTCPTHVTGENCDKCEPYTFGYDPVNGCDDCNCNPLGVERGNLQCNLLNGSCECKQNVVGRTCDHCQSGYWSFPYCQECDCDLRGTTLDICDQQTAECFCKSNVYGQACDLCEEGTFNIQENNDDGCTKCFCFGKTTRCSSSSLYRSQIDIMEDWRLAIVTVSKTVNVEIVDESVERIDTTVGADLTLIVFRDKTVYFVAPSAYLDNRLTSYGGALNYSIFYTPGPFGSAVGGADVILHGAGMYLLYFAHEQPPASVEYSASLDLVESKFVLPTGLPTTREQIMQVLEKLQGIYIRATYWEDSVTSRLLKVSLDSAMSVYSEKGFALSVEQCQCPPNYQGLSCEECADGYYRATTGPYGGYCVPCQCNGHASTCDKVTGICLDCKHNTTGEHCENCDVGYHGNATGGTPYDCLICACPLPITSNNFATGCDVSEDGERISCECKPGYFGARCESCAAGYYGKPEVQNDYCKPCECSGNINPEDPGSCDSVTGECTKCLNNTAGQSCQICAPGYFGDAVSLKDCQSCVCDRCGTDRCDHFSGICQCLPNVVGDKCDKCADQHYGFTTCRGCNACDCQLASESLQCDDISGQCRCKPGVVGRNCDRCASGFWEYTSTGCISCGCNTEYSVGVGCNPKTGQCECLPGVIGEKCDHCPHRWVLIEDQGCFECDTCTHALLDITDYLHNKLQPITEEFQTVAASYFTTQRLNYINNTVAQLRPEVNELSAHQFDIKPLLNTVNDLQQETSALNRKAEYAVENAHGAGGAKIIIDALEVEAVILDAVEQTKATVYEISDLAYNLDSSTGPQIDLALQEAHAILDEITQSDIKAYAQEAEIELVKSEELFTRMEDFAAPAANTTSALESLRERIYQIDHKLDDLKNHSQTAAKKADTTRDLNAQNRNANLPDIVNNLRDLYNKANITLVDARNLLSNATLLFDDANKAFSMLNTQWQENSETKDQLTETLADRIQELDAVQSVVNDARSHSDLLTNQARTLDSLLTDTRYMSESAIKAANAYGNIVYAINESYTAARDALVAAENATTMSNGLGEKTATSNSRSALLLQQAHKALEDAQQELKPQLADAISDVNDVNKMNSKINQIDSDIMKALENIPLPAMKSETEEVVQKADDATARSENALNQIRGIIAELPATHKGAKQLYKDSEQARNAIINANNELDRVNSILPDLKNLADQLKEKPQKMTELGSHMKVDLDLLKKRVAMARDLADRIKLGVTFFRNSTLELRNPESISHQGLNSHVSIYIKTDKPNGLVLYIGNEKGTSRKMRRAVSDDFMALEVQNGFPVLTMDLGSGPEQIIHNKSVSENNWYQIVMDRTGKSVHFTVREDLGAAHDHAVQTHTVERILPGTSTLLNLDREHSKVFVGGYPVTFEIQPSVSYSSFDGRMEELFIGDQQVGLWNFVDAVNINTASRDRDQLVNITTTTGFRLNGEGFIVLDGHSYAMKKRSDVTLKFKTFAKDGLLFLALRDLVFLSVELIDGHVRYQYNLGGGVVSISSPNTYNDGQWHTVDAVRVGKQGALKVDGISISKVPAPGDITELVVSPKLYVGGYPGEHGLDSVTASGFDGCIDEVQIGSTSVDLNQNINAFEVIAGCPNKFAGVVSFEGGARGYARWPNATAREIPVQLILKFKTTGPNGMIAYAADGSASASLYLENGSIIFQSGGQEVKTSPSTGYNDGQWHVVVATSSAAEPLRLDVDDYETFKSPAPAAPIRLLYGNLYFGGVSSNVDAAAALKPQFSGCIGDATLNGVVVNFGNLTDIPNAIIGKCLLDTPLAPDLRTTITSVKRPEIPLLEEEDVSPQPPPPVQSPVEEVSDSPEATESEGGTVVPLAPPEVVSTTAAVPTPLPTPVPMCKLPLYPISDADVTATSGQRFGTKFGSRVEYSQFPGRLKNKYEFSVSIKTVATEGIIFYVTDQRHIDFISLYLKDGRIHYGFNCGSGPALITSPNPYNDGEWHTIEFTRHLTSGRLVIDGQPVATGDSKGSTKTINVIPPFFLGGINPRISEQTKINLKGLNSTFEGCLKDFKMNGKPVGQPASPIGVIPCSENVESGSFFSADGGYIRAYDKFRVGWEIDIKLDIKPRNISGLLVSVHAKKDYLVLQMINGQIKFSVDNGKGEISTAYNPPIPHYFCDGEWHNIQAVKSKNVVTLSVDKNFVDPGIGMSSATDTKHPLYIGGHPNPGRLRGVLTTAQFVGCIRNVEINGNQEKLSTLHAVGNVTQSICPTT